MNANEREWGRAKVAAVAGCGLAFAGIAFAYWWHQSDVFSSIDSAKWYTNGTVNGSGIGLVGTGGSVISKIAVPYTPNDYEVKAKVKLANAGGGDYVLYTRASTNAQSPSTGQYYSAEWLAPSCNGSGSCSGWMSIYKKLSAGSHTQLAFVMATTTNWTAEIRFQALGTGLYVWMNGVMILNATDSGIATGAPGVGVRSTPSGCALERVDVGHRDNGAPTAPSLTVSRFPQNIRIRWQAPTDPSTIPEDAGTGSGVAQYHVWKNSIYQGSFANGSAPGTTIEWVDTAATDPTQTYTYQIGAADYHFNTTYAPTVTVQPSPVPTNYDARQVGVKTLGTYWGAGGENIDLRSGNLNYTLPLVQAQMRGGGGVTVGLTYNSQVWAKLGNVEWRLGDDVGYGFGWKMLIGSVAPVYLNNSINHYVFTDSSGSEYKLTINTGGKWTSKEGIYLTYDTNFSPHRLYFNSGVFWEMGSQSGGIEEDAGTRYPTRIQDTNGNRVQVNYWNGVGASGDNTSARIDKIEDVRAVEVTSGNWRTYSFTYSYGTNDTFPHLRTVTNHINSGERYNLYYWPADSANGFPVTSPFTNVTDWRNIRLLNFVEMPDRENTTYTAGYSSYGELTTMTQPYGGQLAWDHGTFTYDSGGASPYLLRQVNARYVKKAASSACPTPPTPSPDCWQYALSNDTSTSTTGVVHAWTALVDGGGATKTQWDFETSTSSPFTGLLKTKKVFDHPSGPEKVRETVTWTQQSSSLNPYISQVETKYDPGQSYEKTTKSTQLVDDYGMMTQQVQYHYGTTTAGAIDRTFNTTYLRHSSYIAKYILNRVTDVTVTPFGGSAVVLGQKKYDQYGGSSIGCQIWSGCGVAGIQPLTERYGTGFPNPRQHDSTYNTGYDVRGNVTNSGNGGVGGYGSFDILGMPVGGTSGPTQSSASYSGGSNYAAPSQLTPNSNNGLSHSMSWNSHLGLTQDTGPNGAATSISYDGKGRPSSGVDANGMQVLYYYQAAAPQKKTTTNPGDKWVKEYYDGFGRTVKAETGSGATVVSTVETEYGPCACSPMGKVKRVSRPYGSGGSAQYWTTYTYDSLGRTLSVQQPPAAAGGSSAGTTAYLYEGNTVKVTDPAGKWKKFTMDAAGQLVEVREPNPASPTNPSTDFLTTYTYTVKGQLATVSMPRPTGTQTRTFTYHASGAVATVAQPETGTTTNTVGTDTAANDYGMLKTKVDAKGQKVEYIYDAYKRVIEVKRYKVQTDTNPDACQGTKYQYDVNTWDVGFGATNLSGRLAGVEYHVCTYNGDGTLEKDRTIREMYSYSTGGRPLKKRMQLQRTDPLGGSGNGAPITGIANLDAEYTWSAEGTLLTLKYPDLRTGHPNQQVAEKGNTIAYQTDWLRRYSGMTEATALNPGTPVTLVSNMQYGISGELTSMTYNQPSQSSHPVVTETRQYNLLGQLTQITAMQGANTVTNLQYVFPTGTNNGRISSMVNVQSGETVTYTYDALNRLTNAVGSGWSEAYAFDGFGNLTQKGSQSIGVLAASNRLTGPGVAYDSNGNQTGMQVGTTNVTNTFDVENRLLEVSGQGFRYGFGPDNRKMWTKNASNGNEDYVFWGPQGKPIGTYRAAWEWTASSGTLWFNAVVSTRRWMGSKEISATSVLIHDRLSSVVGVSAGGSVSRYRYLPYGEPNTAGGSPVGSHFATYDRTDAGMYYADQRYYRDGVGRFMSADPYEGSARSGEPGSLNRYPYVLGDPVNGNDPDGLVVEDLAVTSAPYRTCFDSMNQSLSAFQQFLDSDVGTLALQTWLEYSAVGDTPAHRDNWRGIANTFRNRWHASEQQKVLLNLKKKPDDKLTFQQMIARSSTSGESHWVERGRDALLKRGDRNKLLHALNARADDLECEGLKGAFEESIAVYNRRQGDQSYDNTYGAMSYVSVWSPHAPPGFPATPANLINPFRAFYTPVVTYRSPFTTYGPVQGVNYAVSFWFYRTVFQR